MMWNILVLVVTLRRHRIMVLRGLGKTQTQVRFLLAAF